MKHFNYKKSILLLTKKLSLLLFTFFLFACSTSDDDSTDQLNLIGTYSSVSGDDCGQPWQFGCAETLTISSSSINSSDCGESLSRGSYEVTSTDSNTIEGDIFMSDGSNDDTFSFNRSSGVLKLYLMEVNCLITETWQQK